MDWSPKELDSSYVFEGRGAAGSDSNDLSAFLKFPSLSRLFQSSDRAALAEMRSQLTLTNQHLERVIRQGTKEDADRAALISRSYDLTLTLLKELEGQMGEPAK